MKLLLHACCGPCSLEPARILRAAGHDLAIYYANSNIAPASEYARRLDTLRAWAGGEGLPVVEGPYAPDAWEATAGRVGEAALAAAGGDVLQVAAEPALREARCRACYRLRFEEAARAAAERGFDAVGTTLSVSPYQFTDVIREELERAAAGAGVRALFEDYRPFYDEATRRSRAAGMYRQNFCGCRFSEAEAAAERAERKRARAAEREAEAAAHADERAAQEAARAAKRAERAAYAEKQARKRAALRALREQGRGER
ncbi:epoxyqueuosine reductase QueH [Gordonibacter urolithinfaciens]|uniref:epoxyqueuosine reductase QueH n=1 Tax=Gordonibacter urolithinfaciens TaxID=1335613 RepID=UPI003A95BA1A